MEEILNSLLLCSVAVDQVFGGSAEDHLAGDTYCCIFFETDRRLLLISVVEDNRHASFGDAGLTALVNEVLESIGQSVIDVVLISSCDVLPPSSGLELSTCS